MTFGYCGIFLIRFINSWIRCNEFIWRFVNVPISWDLSFRNIFFSSLLLIFHNNLPGFLVYLISAAAMITALCPDEKWGCSLFPSHSRKSQHNPFAKLNPATCKLIVETLVAFNPQMITNTLLALHIIHNEGNVVDFVVWLYQLLEIHLKGIIYHN